MPNTDTWNSKNGAENLHRCMRRLEGSNAAHSDIRFTRKTVYAAG